MKKSWIFMIVKRFLTKIEKISREKDKKISSKGSKVRERTILTTIAKSII